MVWARALDEFGATIIFAGNFPGKTQALPFAIYVAMENNFADGDSIMLIYLHIA